MKNILAVLTLLIFLGLSSGCHSGIMKGAGSDMSRMGDSLQK